MTTYSATISHHSIAAARVVFFEGRLKAAKAWADAQFGAERADYTLHLTDLDSGDTWSRQVSDPRWVYDLDY
jgi:hypothetical protein